MHAVMMTSKPALLAGTGNWKFAGCACGAPRLPAAFTIDAGRNIHCLCGLGCDARGAIARPRRAAGYRLPPGEGAALLLTSSHPLQRTPGRVAGRVHSCFLSKTGSG
jgi:hypothetical protein